MLAASLSAQAQKSISLTLPDAQQYALDHNRTIQNATIDIRKAEATKWQSIASMLPQVNAGVDYSNYCGYQMNFGQMQLAMPPFAQLGITTSVALTGAQIVSVGISNISKKMSDITLQKTEQEICDQVKSLYCSALVMQHTINLLEESLASIKKLYEMSCKSVEVGVSEQTDADQLLVQVVNMQNNITSTRRSNEMVYNSLRLMLNLDPNTEIILLDGLDGILDLDNVESVLASGFNIDNNYSYQLLKASTDLSKKQIALTGWSNGPSLSAYHQYTSKKYFSDETTMNMTPPNMIGVSLKVPIFTSLKASSSVKAAKLDYKKQLNTLADTEASLKVQYNQLVYDLRTAMDNYKAQKQNVDVAQRVFDNIAKKYEYGVASSMDVTNSHNSLISAESTYIQSVLSILTAQISLEQLMNNR
jgi:Outer membrane protein